MTKPLTHIQHPEDLILSGELWVVDALTNQANHISVKIDGAPAIVWGTHPQTGKFFVSTKSAFNKKKDKICYTIDDVRKHFKGVYELQDILITCLMNLPVTEGIFQGDFIGFGGEGQKSFTPNTLTYTFSKAPHQTIIVAPHTYYEVDSDTHMSQAVPHPLKGDLISTDDCLFIQPFVDRFQRDHRPFKINKSRWNFLSQKDAQSAIISINALIRSGQELDDQTLIDIIGDADLVNLYQLVISLKEMFMDDLIVYGSPTCSVGSERVLAEGFVIYSDHGDIPLKLVNRHEFAFNNMNYGKFS